METRSVHCPNCSAPMNVPVGEVEALCQYCGSQLRFIPGEEELEVVRTREEMKYRERVAMQKEVLRKRIEQEEMDRWRQTAAKVAVGALPIVGDAAGRALFRAALNRGGGCFGCGCLLVIAALGAAAYGILQLTQ